MARSNGKEHPSQEGASRRRQVTNPVNQTPLSGSSSINPDTTGGVAMSGLLDTLLATVSASFETGAVDSFTAFPAATRLRR